MDKWTDTHRRNFKRYWEQELGQESLQIIKDLKQAKIDQALTLKDDKEIAAKMHEAAGIDEVLQYIFALTN
jgi:hypothetical protein